jgi:hypothetical protein
MPLNVILPFFKHKALVKDMSLPFVKSLEGLNITINVWEPPFKISWLWLLLEIWHNWLYINLEKSHHLCSPLELLGCLYSTSSSKKLGDTDYLRVMSSNCFSEQLSLKILPVWQFCPPEQEELLPKSQIILYRGEEVTIKQQKQKSVPMWSFWPN